MGCWNGKSSGKYLQRIYEQDSKVDELAEAQQIITKQLEVVAAKADKNRLQSREIVEFKINIDKKLTIMEQTIQNLQASVY